MLESAINIINHYIHGASRFNIHSIEMQRGENPEDLFYLCRIDDHFYIIYETDYIGTLSYILNETIRKFTDYDIKPIGWLPKIDNDIDNYTHILEVPDDDKQSRKSLILSSTHPHLRYMLLEVSVGTPVIKQYNPTTYS